MRHTALINLKAYWEEQGFWMRQVRFLFNEPTISETHTRPARHAGWRYFCVFQQQAGGVYQKGDLLLYSRTQYSRPQRHSQLEKRNLVPPHPDHYSIVFSPFISPSPFLYCTKYMHKICFFLKIKWYILIDIKWKWWGKNTGSVKYPFSPLVWPAHSALIFIVQ